MYNYVHTYVHTYMHRYIYTYIHAYIHTYIHIYIYIHNYIILYFRLVVCIVPTPTVIITDDDMGIFIRGTEQSLTCNVTLAFYSPSSPNITVQWMKDGFVLDVSSERVDQSELQVNGNSYISTITFSSLNSTDTGDYTCTGTISPIGSGFDLHVEPYIIGTSITGLYSLTVQGMHMHIQHDYLVLLLSTLLICILSVSVFNAVCKN